MTIRRHDNITPAHATAASLAAIATFNGAHAQVEFVPLGDLPGGAFSSVAMGVSDDGLVVVGSSESELAGNDGFRWTKSTGMERLGDLPGGLVSSPPQGVSGDGLVVVGKSHTGIGAVGFEAYVWTESTGIASIGTLPGGTGEGVAAGTNIDGTIIAGAVDMKSGGHQAYVWTASGGMRGLGYLQGGTRSGIGPLSHDGRRGCGLATSSRGFEAILWVDGQGFTPLGDLPGGIYQSTAFDISGDGRIIVGSSASSHGTEPYRWTDHSGMIGLGDVPGGMFGAGAFGVSHDGWRIVGQGNDELGPAAFIWDPILGIRSLQVALAEEYNLELQNWRLRAANDISANGRTIVGSARNPAGDPEGFLARIPPFCYADCDQSSAIGTLDLQDFLCYQQRFLAADLYSDCNQDGNHDIFDFLCFQDHFIQGCG